MLDWTESKASAAIARIPLTRLDAAIASDVKSEIIQKIDEGTRRIILDMEMVEFMDSSGLGALVGCVKRAGASGSVELAMVHPTVLKILRLTRMTQVFPLHDKVPAL